MLTVENLSKSFGTIQAVRHVSFTIQPGEVVGLLGPNGAGKTTTMRLITGFLQPDAGEVTLNGLVVSKNPMEVRKQIGYLPENAPSYFEMEVVEFLEYAMALREVPSGKRASFLKEAVSLCNLKEVVGRTIGTLSKGFRQRVCLAQALIHQPPLLILDEPTSGLDPHQIQEIRSLIKEIGKERTVILSTHIMQEVQAVCQRALIIARGTVVGQGTLAALTQQGSGKSKYFVKIKAPKTEIQEKAGLLKNINLEAFLETSNGKWQEVVLASETPEDFSESIFQWVVDNHWSLSELRRETTSLEEVFLELTKQ